jgi:hypothetical protein
MLCVCLFGLKPEASRAFLLDLTTGLLNFLFDLTRGQLNFLFYLTRGQLTFRYSFAFSNIKK